MRLQGKIFIFILLISILPLLIVGMFSLRSLRAVFEEQVFIENKEISTIAGNKVEHLLDQCRNDLLTVHLLIEGRMTNEPALAFRDVFRTKNDPILEVVRSIVIRSSPFVRIRIIEPDGEELLRFTRFDEISPARSAAGDPFFFPSISADMQYPPWMDSAAATTYTTFSCWIRKNQSLHGLVVLDLDVAALTRILSEKSAEAAGEYFLFDGSGRVIAGAGQALIHSDDALQREYAEFVGRFRDHPMSDFVTSSATLAGRKIFLSTIPVREHISFKNPEPEERWYLGLARGATPLAAAFDRSQKIFYAVIVFCVLLAIVVSVFAARWITAPINTLGAAASKFAKGDLNQSIVLRRSDEIGELAVSLNNMAADIKTLMHERQLNETLVTIGRISAALAHDLKNPIEGLKLLSHELRKRLQPGNVEYELIETIEQSVQRLSSLVSNTLDFTRLREPAFSRTNLLLLIEEALTDFDFRHVEVRRDFPASLPEPEIDPGQLRRVLSNLVKNAFEACYALSPEDHPRITLRVRRSGDAVELEIADTGAGIPPELAEKIFEPFFTTKTTGHGLGLAFVRQIIANHHGTISCASEAGTGTRITLVIPLEQKAGNIDSAALPDPRRRTNHGA